LFWEGNPVPKLKPNAVPAYRLHKQSGQGIVTLGGRDFLLGPHGSAAGRREYDRLVGEWVAAGRPAGGPWSSDGPLVSELILAYWRHAKVYYRKHGRRTSEVDLIRHALKPLKKLYGTRPAREFRPLALRAVRERMIAKGWSRKTVNGHIDRVKRLYKWAVAQEMVTAEVYQALCAVAGLRRGRTEARETEPVRPVPDAHVDAVIRVLSPALAELIDLEVALRRAPQEGARTAVVGRDSEPPESHTLLGRQFHPCDVECHGLDGRAEVLAARVPGESPVAAMIQLQRLTGMRPGELVLMRTGDLEMTTAVTQWAYTPAAQGRAPRPAASRLLGPPRDSRGSTLPPCRPRGLPLQSPRRDGGTTGDAATPPQEQGPALPGRPARH
jgi:integrase